MSKKHSRVQGGWAKQSTSSGGETRQGRQASQYTYQAPAERVMPAIRPPNFTWIIQGILAGSAYPSRSHHFQYYMNEGIRHLVSLTEWKPPMQCAPAGLHHIFMPVSEFEAPSLKQMDDFTSLVDAASQKNEGVAVHCHWGLGRTGTMLAAYLVKAKGVSAQEAILEIRHQRPYSIETWEQEEAVINYAQFLRNNPEQTPDSQTNNREQSPESGAAENDLENAEKNEARDEPH